MDSSSDSEQTICPLLKFQSHSLKQVLHSKYQMHDMSKVVQYLFLLEQTIAKNKRLSKSLHGVSLLRLPDVLERQ